MTGIPPALFVSAVSVILLLNLTACSDEPAPATNAVAETPVGTTVPDGHNSRIALDWAGTYSGVLPCASCPGIEITITLGEDGSFERRMVYIDESPIPVVDSGKFSWDDAGRSVTLAAVNMAPQQYQVGENVLFQLDQEGNRIEGALAGHYILHQHIRDPQLEDRKWALVELRGQPVEIGENQREAFLFLRAEDGRMHGNASCNMYNGFYAIKIGQRIKFDRNIAMTMMACPDMQLEQSFMEVLQMVDNYSLGEDGTMMLNRARMAPLARFVER